MTKLMTVLVCGGRDYKDRERLYRLLDFNRAKIALIVHGGAAGADMMAGGWACAREVPCLRVPARWSKFGKKAGFIRNEAMLSLGHPDLVVAFPGGAGTAMMVRLAKQSGIRVIDVATIDRHEREAEAIDDAVEAQRDRLNHCEDWPTQQALALHDGAPK